MAEMPPPNKAATRALPGHDIFCTPENSDFVSKVPYQSLSTTEKEIRLLKILPDSGSGFVECELLPRVKHADIEKQYLALSYCAGSAKNTEPIVVNGVKSHVFANLHHALMEARHYWQTHADQQDFLLWVDQICINQFDLAERSHQVGFMRDIYEKARHTLICLSTPEAHGEDMRWIIIMRKRDLELEPFPEGYLSSDSREKSSKERWTALNGVANSPWWTRAWVFQEFVVSEQATFLYGSHSMPYLDLVLFASGLPGPETPPVETITSALKRIFIDFREILKGKIKGFMLAKLNQSKTTDLKLLLSYTANCQATDIRDKIYSILGLADPRYEIVPDYSRNIDINDLLVETTKKIILFDGNLEVLLYLDRYDPFCPNPRGTLPSWVIDWTDGTGIEDATEYGFGALRKLFINNSKSPKFLSFKPDGTTPTSLDATFMQVQHPKYPEMQTEVIQAWACFLDDGFYEDTDSVFTFEGSRGFSIVEYHGVSSDYELWAIRGTNEPFFLCKYSYGYRIVGSTFCENLMEKLKFVPGVGNDDEDTIDLSKMEETRITIF